MANALKRDLKYGEIVLMKKEFSNNNADRRVKCTNGDGLLKDAKGNGLFVEWLTGGERMRVNAMTMIEEDK